MKKRYLLSVSTVFLTLSIIIVGSAVAVARNQGQPETPLAQRVLQRNDLPDNETYYAEQVTDDRFPGSLSPVNIPLQVKGFLEGYEMSAWYPCVFRGEAGKEFAKDGQGGAFVLNVAYRYQDKDQAATALKQQLEWFNKQDIAVDAKANHMGYDESLAAANGMHGRAMQLTYSQEDQTWVTYWFFGIEGDTLTLLMVDGLPDPATREVFDTLVAKIVQH